MLPDIDTVTGIVRTVAAEEVMPRFRNLADHDVAEKKHPTDLVTTADIEAEKRLVAALTDLVSGSVVIGEEGAEADPGLFRALAGDAPVWLVDPVDGTLNFARGEACFAVVVAFCMAGETKAGWILDPVTGRTSWAVAGEGAWTVDNGKDTSPRKLKAATTRAVGQMTGSLGPRLAKRVREASLAGQGDAPAKTVRYGCTGQEYLDLGAAPASWILPNTPGSSPGTTRRRRADPCRGRRLQPAQQRRCCVSADPRRHRRADPARRRGRNGVDGAP